MCLMTTIPENLNIFTPASRSFFSATFRHIENQCLQASRCVKSRISFFPPTHLPIVGLIGLVSLKGPYLLLVPLWPYRPGGISDLAF